MCFLLRPRKRMFMLLRFNHRHHHNHLHHLHTFPTLTHISSQFYRLFPSAPRYYRRVNYNMPSTYYGQRNTFWSGSVSQRVRQYLLSRSGGRRQTFPIQLRRHTYSTAVDFPEPGQLKFYPSSPIWYGVSADRRGLSYFAFIDFDCCLQIKMIHLIGYSYAELLFNKLGNSIWDTFVSSKRTTRASKPRWNTWAILKKSIPIIKLGTINECQ